VNLLLLDDAELRSDGTFTITDRRAEHLRTVLGVKLGSTVRAGIVGRHVGTAEVLAVDDAAITLRYEMATAGVFPTPIDLVLALPRPKVITRTIEIAASFAVKRIDLTNAWRVDKSYLGSPRLAPEALALAARFGAEQGATVHLPQITVHQRLMAMLDDRFPGSEPIVMRHTITGQPTLRLIAHPGAPPLESVYTTGEYVALAIGPEGGWIERELETFIARGFKPVSLGAPVLRVEAAVASALGQLMMLQRMS
jgi:16S rRNA (uracil1498-N3)-methyltransferase